MNKTLIPADQALRDFLQAVIWDMDGVLIDSMELHYKIWKQIFSEYHVYFARKDFNRHFGTTNLQTVQTVMGNKLTFRESVDLAEKRQGIFEQHAIAETQLIPGAIQWLQFFLDSGIPQAVASSNAQLFIEAVTKHLKIKKYFQVLVSAEGLASKPDPAVFLESARRMNAQPSRCLVIEDAVAGVDGAKNAGMQCIALTTTNPPSSLAKADLIISNFSALTRKPILNLMAP